jgi:hypothetical protein
MKGSNLIILLKIGGYSLSSITNGDVRTLTFWDVTNDCIVETYDDTSNNNHKFWETIDDIDLLRNTISIKGDFKFKKRKNPTPYDTPCLNADASFQLSRVTKTDMTWDLVEELVNLRPTLDLQYKTSKTKKASKYAY